MAGSSGSVAASRVDQVVSRSQRTQVAPICLEEAIVRLVRVKDEPAQPGKAIQAKWTTRRELAKLRALIGKAKKQGDLRTWRRGKRQGGVGLRQRQEGDRDRGGVRGGARGSEPVASLVRHRRDRGAVAAQ